MALQAKAQELQRRREQGSSKFLTDTTANLMTISELNQRGKFQISK